ncbi:MAG: hypothetical protein ACRD2P_19045 [Terriglobia bacterium]
MDTYLSDDFLRQLTAAGEVDVLVSVPTSNNRQTIEHVVNAIQVGLVKYFPRERTALMNPDASSRDGTQEILKSASVRDFRSYLTASPLRSLRTLTTSYHPSRGQAGALRLTMAAADLLRAKACVVVSPDVTSLAPEWVDGLARPVFREGFDLLTPIYQRHRFEGLLVRNLLSPVVRAAYGFRIEEPAPDEVAFSGKLASYFLAQNVWQEDFMRDGAPVWMTTTALANNFRACQSFLGPKVYSVKHSSQDLAGTLQHIVGALFQSLETHDSFWPKQSGSQDVPVFGFPSEIDLGPARVNRKKMFEMFQKGTNEIISILEQVLSASTLQEVLEVAKGEEAHCWFPDELWVKTVYEFAASYHRRVMNRDHLLQALTPVYRGRISSYLRENRGATLEQLRERREALQMEYERMKPFLVEGWSAKT